jgi:hypothetical protein
MKRVIIAALLSISAAHAQTNIFITPQSTIKTVVTPTSTITIITTPAVPMVEVEPMPSQSPVPFMPPAPPVETPAAKPPPPPVATPPPIAAPSPAPVPTPVPSPVPLPPQKRTIYPRFPAPAPPLNCDCAPRTHLYVPADRANWSNSRCDGVGCY